MNTPDLIKDADSIVIKIGSVLITDKSRENVRQDWLDAFALDIQELHKQGKKITIVSSGAIALGRKALGIAPTMAPSSIPLEKKQAASAVGQFHLFAAYFKNFSTLGLQAAQVLLTMSETENRRMHLNARATLGALHDENIIPIINENDTVSTGEIRFGDNDRLAVRVGQMIEADLVILLSTTDGLYTADPIIDKNAKHLPLIQSIGKDHMDMAGDAVPGLSTGGMKSKIEAALSATRSGLALVIAKGTDNHALEQLCSNTSKLSTLFIAQESKSNARRRWIEAHLNPKGSVFIDDGALKALQSGRSLLPIGVKNASGNFTRGDVITIRTMNEEKVGIGITAYNAEDTKKIMGLRSDKIEKILGYIGRAELIHRNDMVLKS
ncbi:MAG: glutamate 5-kinase [Alphaproteobacteria bacterium]